jgi:hypothetical protein
VGERSIGISIREAQAWSGRRESNPQPTAWNAERTLFLLISIAAIYGI